jgi:TP901 family phage tail tape measure protein
VTTRTVTVRMSVQNAQAIGAIKQTGTVAEQTAARMTRSGKTVEQRWATVGRGARNVAIGGALALGVIEKANYSFDKSMSRVDAATHASASTLKELRDAAVEAGAKTVYSSSEAADGITELAKAGVSARDILKGGLTGALSLASAGELSVADSASYMATALTQFQLPGTKATHVADLLAAGAGKAQGEVSDMALALNYAGVPAAQLGVSIEQTAGTIALLAKNGIWEKRPVPACVASFPR